jgi:hypothetical protein
MNILQDSVCNIMYKLYGYLIPNFTTSRTTPQFMTLLTWLSTTNHYELDYLSMAWDAVHSYHVPETMPMMMLRMRTPPSIVTWLTCISLRIRVWPCLLVPISRGVWALIMQFSISRTLLSLFCCVGSLHNRPYQPVLQLYNTHAIAVVPY